MDAAQTGKGAIVKVQLEMYIQDYNILVGKGGKQLLL